MPHRGAQLRLILAMMLWGTSYSVAKLALAHYEPFFIAFGRVAIACLVFSLLRLRTGRIRVHAGDWRWLLLMAFCEPFLYFTLEVHALEFTSGAAVATLVALLPIVVALAARYCFGERATPPFWAGLILAVAGALLLGAATPPSAAAPAPLLGNSLAVLAMLAGVGYTLTARHLGVRYSPWFLAAVQAFVSGLLFLPFLWFSPWATGPLLAWPGLLAILYLGVAASVVAYSFYNDALGRMPATRVAVYVSLMPVFAALGDWLLLDAPVDRVQALAIGLVVAGVVQSQRSRVREAAAPRLETGA